MLQNTSVPIRFTRLRHGMMRLWKFFMTVHITFLTSLPFDKGTDTFLLKLYCILHISYFLYCLNSDMKHEANSPLNFYGWCVPRGIGSLPSISLVLISWKADRCHMLFSHSDTWLLIHLFSFVKKFTSSKSMTKSSSQPSSSKIPSISGTVLIVPLQEDFYFQIKAVSWAKSLLNRWPSGLQLSCCNW